MDCSVGEIQRSRNTFQSKLQFKSENKLSVIYKDMDNEGSDNDLACRTNIVLNDKGLGDVHSWNGPNVDSVCGPFRIRYDRTDGSTIKIRRRRVCIRHQFYRHVFDNTVCRTHVTKGSNVEMESESIKCMKLLRLGKFHSRF